MKKDESSREPGRDRDLHAPSAQGPRRPTLQEEDIAQITLEYRSNFDRTPRAQKIESAQKASRWLDTLLGSSVR